MKRLLLLFIMAFAIQEAANAQAFVQIGVDSSVQSYLYGPLYRSAAFSSFNHSHYAYLYESTELTNLPSGALITGVSWHAQQNTGGLSGGNNVFNIHLANTAQTTISLTSNTYALEVAQATAVYQNAAYDLPAGGGWFNHVFATPFIYTGGNLKILTEHEKVGTASGAINYHWELATGLAGGFSSSTNTANSNFSISYSNRRPNIRISYVVPTGTDLAVQNLLSPVSPIGTGASAQVSVQLGNFAANAITSANVTYQLNGGTPVTESFTGNIASAASDIFTFVTPITIPQSNFNLTVYVSNINGQGADNNPSNDTLTATICPAMPGGTYTVGGAAADFATIRDAVTAMQCGGISGSVNFLINPGVYYSSVDVSNIAGAGVNTITFSSATASALDVLIYPDTVGTQIDHFIVNGTQGVSFNALTFLRNQNVTTTSYYLQFTNGANSGIVSGCRFIDSTTSTSTLVRGVGILSSNFVNIIQNSFDGLLTPIYFMGVGDFNVVTANIIQNYKYRAIDFQGQTNLVIDGNLIENFAGTSTFGGGIYGFNNSFLTISNNRVIGGLTRYGIYLSNYNSSETQPTLVYNNVIAGTRAASLPATMIYSPLYFQASFSATSIPPNPVDYAEIVNNTINVNVNTTSTSTLGQAVYFGGGFGTSPALGKTVFKNNNIVCIDDVTPANFRVLRFANTLALDSLESDYNNIIFEGSTNNLIRVNSPITEYPTLADWVTATGQDSNSVSVAPAMAALNTPVPSAAGMDNLGQPVAYVLSDVTGQPRDAVTPDIGAYEFSPSAADIGVTAFLTPQQNCNLDTAEQVSVRLVNNGQDSIFAYTLDLYLNSTLVVSDAITASIAPGANATHIFTSTVNMVAGGNYNFLVIATLAGDANPLNDTLRNTIFNPLTSVFPLVQNFDALPIGIPASFPDGWSTAATGGFVWVIGTGTTPSSFGTGPSGDNTTGNGKYIFTEASFGVFGDTAWLISPCLDMAALTMPMVEYYYHMFGTDIDRLIVEAEVGGAWQIIDQIIGQQQTANADAYLMKRALLPAGTGAVRFAVLRGTSFNGDLALDDIRILESPQTDFAAVSFISPATAGCGFTNAEALTVRMANVGQDTLFNVPVSYSLMGAAAVTDTILQIVPGDSINYTFSSTLDLSVPNNYSLVVYGAVANDGDSSNDTIATTIFSIPLISSSNLPFVDDFESGAIGWTTGGSNNSWALGAPSGTTIATAASGTNAWVTNLSGNYNPNENSYIQSPCFDFSNVVGAVVELDIVRDSENGWDGSQLLYSTDGGNTWTRLGDMTSGISNWYNNQNNAGPLAGQPVWTGRLSAQGWLRAAHNLDVLNNQASVMFRINFGSDGSVQFEGTAVDNFAIRVPQDPVIFSMTQMGDSCSVVSRMIEASIINYAPLTDVNLHYDLTGAGTFTAVPMTYSTVDSFWSATIPAGTPAQRIHYLVTVLDSAGLTDTSAVLDYIDDYLSVDAGSDTTIAAGDTATLVASSGFGTGGTLGDPTLVATNSCGGGFMMDITSASGPLFVTGFDLLPANIGSQTVSVYYISGSKDGSQTNQALWTLEGTYTINPMTNTVPEFLAIAGFLVPAGGTVGVYLQYHSRYANGSTAFANADATITNGEGLCTNWATCCTPRQWVGSVYYGAPFNFEWFELPAGTSVGTGDTLLVTPTLTTSYAVTVSDSFCTAIDTVTVFVTSTNVVDAGLVSIVTPTNPGLNSPEVVEVVIENFGTDPVTNFDVAFSINGVELNANPISRTIQPGDTIHHIFTQSWTPTVGGDLELCAYIKGLAGDVDPSNDTSCTTYMAVSVEPNANLVGRVYPNPANESVFFDFIVTEGEGTLEIFDQLGRIMHSEFIELSKGATHEVKTGTYASAMYNYRFIAGGKIQYGNVLIRR